VSGWIKFEKDLRTDPRVLHMARRLTERFTLAAGGNAHALPAVTLVLGALAQLWSMADSHADSDVLVMSVTDLDAYVGIPGFCALMPRDWLHVSDDSTIELPGFQEHNGPEARARAVTQRRVARFRSRNVPSLQTSNAAPLPDKTRPDKTRQDHSEEEARASRLPTDCETTAERRRDAEGGRGARLPADFDLTAERRKVAEAEHLDPERTFKKFADHWKAASGANARKRDWDAAWRNWCRNEADRRPPNGSASPPNGSSPNGGGPRPTKFEQMQARLGDNEVDGDGNQIPF
jgi:hypothetical protein